MKPGPYLIWGLLGAGAIVGLAAILMQSAPATTERALADGNAFRTTAVLGGRQHHGAFDSFVGGEANAFLGGVELDLRGSTMSEDAAAIEVFVMMGGINIRIPEGWEVVNDVNVVMGGVDDKTRRPNSDSSKRLVLHGTVLMGGLNIRN